MSAGDVASFVLDHGPAIIGACTLVYALYSAWNRNVLHAAISGLMCFASFVLGW